MPLGYAGRFAASVPVAGYTTADCVPDHRPGNFWLLFNEHEYADKGDRARLDEMIRTVTSRGGEYRVSSFPQPDGGHCAWWLPSFLPLLGICSPIGKARCFMTTRHYGGLVRRDSLKRCIAS
jgi:hypothetical protein